MIEVTLDNLEQFMSDVEILLGNDFIHQQIDTYNIEGLNWAQVKMAEARVHPLAPWWRAFKEDILSSQKAGSLKLSDQSLRILNMVSDLKDIQSVQNVERIIESIKGKSTFHSALFEAFITSAYISNGIDVKVVQEQGDQGIRTSDLMLVIDGKYIPVECKSLEDISLKESRHWDELQHRISKALNKYKRNWLVNIQSNKQIDAREVDLVYLAILSKIRQNDLTRSYVCSDQIAIDYSKLSEWDQEFIGPIQLPMPAQLGTVDAEIRVREDGVQITKNLHVLLISPYIEADVSDRLISEFKKATGQIPREGLGLIHIALPFTSGSKLLEVVDKSYSKVFRKINKDSRRVNAVIISGAVIERKLSSPLVYNHYLVPNYNPRSELPLNFSILGSNDTGMEIPDSEGTVDFIFALDEEWHQGVPSFIFNHLSRDGKYQLRVWRTWSDKIRMDLVLPSYGRVFIEGNVPSSISSTVFQYFTGTWSEKGLALYLNGNKISS